MELDIRPMQVTNEFPYKCLVVDTQKRLLEVDLLEVDLLEVDLLEVNFWKLAFERRPFDVELLK